MYGAHPYIIGTAGDLLAYCVNTVTTANAGSVGGPGTELLIVPMQEGQEAQASISQPSTTLGRQAHSATPNPSPNHKTLGKQQSDERTHKRKRRQARYERESV